MRGFWSDVGWLQEGFEEDERDGSVKIDGTICALGVEDIRSLLTQQKAQSCGPRFLVAAMTFRSIAGCDRSYPLSRRGEK